MGMQKNDARCGNTCRQICTHEMIVHTKERTPPPCLTYLHLISLVPSDPFLVCLRCVSNGMFALCFHRLLAAKAVPLLFLHCLGG